MAINNESLVKFVYGVASKAATAAGHITFASDTRQLFVGDGDNAVAFAGNVANAVFAGNKLTITYNDDTPSAVLDFSDVASAEGVSSLLSDLRKDVEANKTAIATETAERKAADISLGDRITSLETAVGEGGSVSTQITEAIEALDSSANTDNDFFKLEVVEENGKVTGVNFTNKNIASASDLSDVSTLLGEVKTTAEAAQTADEVSTAISTAIDALGGAADDVDDSSFVKVAVTSENGEVKTVTVTTTDIASATTLADVKGRLDTFLNEADLNSTVDTLKEIQEWINGDGVNATELTQAIAEEADLRALADSSIRIDFAAADTTLSNRIKAVEDDYLKGADKTELTTAINGVSTVANAAAVKTTTDASLALKADASAVYTKSETYTKTEVNGLVAGANTNASTAESNAKAYADAIKVNGQAQSGQNITVSGLNILVGGTGNHKDASLSTTVEDLYSKVEAASEAGVQSLAVDSNSSNYAEVDASTGAVTLTIKKVAVAAATESNTGVADAWDVKESIRVAKEGAISAVQGEAGDASTAATVAGAKAYADAQIEANALRWTVLS